MFEINKKYKIQDLTGIYYTATIIQETDDLIFFTDLNNQKIGLSKKQILRWKEMENSTEKVIE